MEKIKNLALVAHDNRKADLIEWVGKNYESIMHHKWICTGTTGALIEESLKKKLSNEKKSKLTNTITKLKSGPLYKILTNNTAFRYLNGHLNCCGVSISLNFLYLFFWKKRESS